MIVLTHRLIVLTAILISSTVGFAESLPAINESGFEEAEALSAQTGSYTLLQPSNIRFAKKNILELRVEVPAGAKIKIPADYQIAFLDLRRSDGTTERSSTGFVTPITIVSIPNEPQKNIDEYNATSGGLYITASITSEMAGISGDFQALNPGNLGAGYLKNYTPKGQPKFSYTRWLQKRFGARLNRAVDPLTQSPAERNKWLRIWNELKRASNRIVQTPKLIIMIDKKLAIQDSIRYEQIGAVPLNGSWTIATQGTAVRHDFANVPCAEFMSEMVREAYERAGYLAADDFNDAKHNRLIYTQTATVVGFSQALFVAGWVPWDTTLYQPVSGALLMNASADTPGHAYISAGDEGRFIVDNGAPQGRDLRGTSQKILDMMYQTGVFFLPPGINPKPW